MAGLPPGTDLISELALVEEQGEKLSATELIATCVLLLNAGHEASVNGFGNGMVAAMRTPEQWQKLIANPRAMADTAVDAFFFFFSPLLLFFFSSTLSSLFFFFFFSFFFHFSSLFFFSYLFHYIFSSPFVLFLSLSPSPPSNYIITPRDFSKTVKNTTLYRFPTEANYPNQGQ